MSGLEDFARLVDGDHGLCVVSTLRADGTIASSVVNAGVIPHPVTGDQVVGTAAGGTHDDFAAYDQVMADERRTAVLVSPARVSPRG